MQTSDEKKTRIISWVIITSGKKRDKNTVI